MTKTAPDSHPLRGTLRGQVQPLGDKVKKTSLAKAVSQADQELIMHAGRFVK